MDRKAELALLVGGVLAIVGTYLAFATVKGPGGEVSLTGSEADEASNYLVAGVLAFITAAAFYASKNAMVRKVMAVIAILGIGFLGVYAAIKDITSVSDIAGDTPGVEASVGIGLYVVLLGSVIALIGAAMGFRDEATVTTRDTTTPAV